MCAMPSQHDALLILYQAFRQDAGFMRTVDETQDDADGEVQPIKEQCNQQVRQIFDSECVASVCPCAVQLTLRTHCKP